MARRYPASDRLCGASRCRSEISVTGAGPPVVWPWGPSHRNGTNRIADPEIHRSGADFGRLSLTPRWRRSLLHRTRPGLTSAVPCRIWPWMLWGVIPDGPRRFHGLRGQAKAGNSDGCLKKRKPCIAPQLTGCEHSAGRT